MANTLLIIALAIFGAGLAVGGIAVVSVGIRREERRFREIQRRREERFFQTGEMQSGYFPVDAPDHLTGGARWLTGLWVRRQPAPETPAVDQDLFVQ